MDQNNVNEAGWLSQKAKNLGTSAMAKMGSNTAKGAKMANNQAERLLKDFKFYLGRTRQKPSPEVLKQWATHRQISTNLLDQALSSSGANGDLVDKDLQGNNVSAGTAQDPQQSSQPAANNVQDIPSQPMYNTPSGRPEVAPNQPAPQRASSQPAAQATPQEPAQAAAPTPKKPEVGEVRTASDGKQYKWEGAAWTTNGRMAKKAISQELNSQVTESIMEAGEAMSMNQVRDVMYSLSGLLARSTGQTGQVNNPIPEPVQQNPAPQQGSNEISQDLLAKIDSLNPEQLKTLRQKIQGKLRK